ncbi:hypothetical protein GBF38_021042 [Nibea albiflora]|uniref:Uncharacterized protein n=1 Tax=Nibea albiflora TaxID=240163 RepID=A0ACB7EXD3_NIBAL|nr:hypothetical protein GBF38_021042 [Nibea albiflora]
MQSLCFSSDPGTQRHSTYTATETDSNPSYENPVVVESDNDDPGYIIVLPEGATPVTNQSRASTPSSGKKMGLWMLVEVTCDDVEVSDCRHDVTCDQLFLFIFRRSSRLRERPREER